MRRTVIVTAIVVAIGAFACWAGWVTFTNSGNKASVTVDADEVKKDTLQAVESGKELLEKAADSAQKSIDSTKESVSRPDTQTPDRDAPES
jgi:hypothetical protein